MILDQFKIDEVHGGKITAAITVEDKTMLVYASDIFDSKLYILDWNHLDKAKPFSSPEKDGRVKMVMHSGLIQIGNNFGLACYVCGKMYQLSKSGEFISLMSFDEIFPDAEKVTNVANHSSGTPLITWQKDGLTFVSKVNFEQKSQELLFQYDKGFLFFESNESIIALHPRQREFVFYDSNFQEQKKIIVGDSMFDNKKGVLENRSKSLSIGDPISVGSTVYLTWNERVGKERKLYGVFIENYEVRTMPIKPIAKSPNGDLYLVKNYSNDGELEIISAKVLDSYKIKAKRMLAQN